MGTQNLQRLVVSVFHSKTKVVSLLSFWGLIGACISQNAYGASPFVASQELHAESEPDPSVELLTWGRDTIIHRGRKDIYLSHYPPHKSVVVLIVNDVPWTSTELRNLSGEFIVHAPAGYGIMGVVQALYLRTSQTKESCLDYIQFYDPLEAIGSSKICGRLQKEDKSYTPRDLLGTRVFHSPSGTMQIHYQSEKGEPELFHDKNYEMSFHMVEIVFTAYTGCEFGEVEDAETSRCGDQCMSSHVFCDERINCGFQEDFAVDEENCGKYNWNGKQSQLESTFRISLYISAVLLVVILVASIGYHQHNAYRRIKNIPHQ